MLRLQLVYQGGDIAVVDARGVDMTIGPTQGPFSPASKHSGFWVELRDAAEVTLYSEGVHDPTRFDIHPMPGGKLTGGTRDWCKAKLISVDLPNDPRGRRIVVFSSPYGTNGPAQLVGYFTLP